MCLLLFLCVNLALATYTSQDIWHQTGIVPGVIKHAPTKTISVIYGNNTTVNYGNELTHKQSENLPELSWNAKEDSLYTLVLTDPLYLINFENYEYLHWLVGNIPEKQVQKGEILMSYVGPTPPPGSGLHTYIFLVFKQKQEINFEIPASREGFFIQKFAEQYELGEPQFGNFFTAQYQED